MSRRLAVLATAAAALALAGCSNSPSDSAAASGTPTSGASSSGSAGGGDVAAWAEKLCSSITKDVAALSTSPTDNPTDPVAAKSTLDAFFGTLSDALGSMSGNFKAAGDPPVDGGAALAQAATKQIDEAKATVEQARTKLSAVDTSSPEAFQAGVVEVTAELQKIAGSQDPTKGLRANADVDAAFKSAPSCKALDSTASATPTAAAPTS